MPHQKKTGRIVACPSASRSWKPSEKPATRQRKVGMTIHASGLSKAPKSSRRKMAATTAAGEVRRGAEEGEGGVRRLPMWTRARSRWREEIKAHSFATSLLRLGRWDGMVRFTLPRKESP